VVYRSKDQDELRDDMQTLGAFLIEAYQEDEARDGTGINEAGVYLALASFAVLLFGNLATAIGFTTCRIGTVPPGRVVPTDETRRVS